jgi:chromosome segregation ATPase
MLFQKNLKDKINIHISSLKDQLNQINTENQKLTKEIEQQETQYVSFQENKLKANDILNDRKNKFTVLKREVEVKKLYLNNIIENKKEKINSVVNSYMTEFQEIIDKVKMLTSKLNEIAQNLQNCDSNSFSQQQQLQLIPLINIDDSIFNIVKSGK